MDARAALSGPQAKASHRPDAAARLLEENARLRAANAELEAETARLGSENERLRAEAARLEARERELVAQVEELRRTAKRQAAPFSKGEPKASPRRPGRKPGEAYGRKARRALPDQVDEVVAVPLPEACPHCGGALVLERVASQYQEDLPFVRPYVCRYEIAIGRCLSCRRRIQARHPEQTSDALGAAAAQIGPRAVALAASLNKELGLPVAKVARALRELGGLEVTPGGLQQALARAARSCVPTYAALVAGIRASPAVACDETGWRVGGRRQWLWDFVGEGITVYRISPGRGYEQAAEVLGHDFAGVIERDGWAPYRRFQHARHQSCLAHLLRRCREMIADAERGQARVPHALRRILRDALVLRDRHAAGSLAPEELAREVQALEARVDKLLAGRVSHPPNRRLLAHLRTERAHLLTFLTIPGVEATSWRAEQALRPAVCNRKHWGGNRSWAGAKTQQVLMSVFRSCRQQGVEPVGLLVALARERAPGVAGALAIPGGAPSADELPLAA